MQGPALIISCGHKATETSTVAECLPALERLHGAVETCWNSEFTTAYQGEGKLGTGYVVST